MRYPHIRDRWQANQIVAVTLGMDQLGQELLRDGLADAGVAFFPERYGEVIIPAALAMLHNDAVPNTMHVTTEVVTKQTLGKYY